MTSKLIKVLTIAAIGSLIPAAAMAATTTTTFQVTATVAKACSTSATDMAFGTYTGAQVDQTSTISVTCTLLTTYDVDIDAGVHAASATDYAGRAMSNGTDELAYQLYTNVGRTTIWGDGTTGGSSDMTGIGTGLAQSLTVFGRLASGQNVSAGSYVDSPVTVTVNY